MAYTNKEKIDYFQNEKIPNLEIEIKALLEAYSNDEKNAIKMSWQYRSAKQSLLFSENRLKELKKIQEYSEKVGNLPSTTLTIEKDELLLICAKKRNAFDVNSSNYINTKFKSGRACFEKIVLNCEGLTLRCDILKPKLKRDKLSNLYTISFEDVVYTASAITTRKIEALKKS